MPQMRLLLTVGDDPGMASGALAAALGVRPSTVTGIVDRLQRQGLVRRDPDAEDRRIVRTFLTRRGVEVITDVVSESRPYLGQILEGMEDADLLTLARGLCRWTAKAEERGLLAQPAASCMKGEAEAEGVPPG